MFEWYFGFRPLIRFCIALVPLGIAGLMLANGRFWPWGWAVGGVLVLASFPTRGEKSEWGDW